MKTVIEMAREAGAVFPADGSYHKFEFEGSLERFAELVRAEALAEQALDKKAENARELGLDYEPVCNKDPQGCWNVRCQLGKKCKNTPAQPMHPEIKKMYEDYFDKCFRESSTAERTWVGLTDEEIDDIYQGVGKNDLMLVREVEAKLREKNT